jgi:spore germination protein GerM
VRQAAAVAILLALGVACGRSSRPSTEPAKSESLGAAAPFQIAAPEGTEAPAKVSVTVYFPSASDDLLAGEPREIVETARPADRGAQILAALLEGPKGPGALPAVPAGTTLRRLWVRDDGTAYADFSDELSSGMRGGASDEILTLYAIVDSLTLNVPEIRRVGVLIGGRERETLGGHVDLRRPLLPDRSLLAEPATEE